jgi:prevent-host-death family protein
VYGRDVAVVNASEARAGLPEILDRVAAGEEIIITRHGRPVAVVLHPDAVRSRRADAALATADRIRELLRSGRASPLPTGGGLSERRAEELIDEIRGGREAR